MTWATCEKQVKGFKGCRFKSFLNKEEAELYLAYADASNYSSAKAIIDKKVEDLMYKEMIAFTDGSYDDKLNRYGYGVVIIHTDGETVEISKSDDNELYLASRNVSGEIFGALRAIEYAATIGEGKLSLFYDYEGIEKWATGKWNAYTPISKYYKKQLEEYIDYMDITFYKVQAHANIELNERADFLAKKSLKIRDKSNKHCLG